jgi:hypothetical protein
MYGPTTGMNASSGCAYVEAVADYECRPAHEGNQENEAEQQRHDLRIDRN